MESRTINFKDSNLVSKANSIIEASYKLGVMEQKIISTIASNINPTDKDFQTYTFSIKEFRDLIGSKSKNIYGEVDKITTKLMQPFMFINAEGKPTRIAWLSKATYNTNEGSVTVRFDPDLKPFFLFLNEKFTRYKLGNIIHLRSSYSIRMYELLKSYEGLTERTFALDELRDKLGLDDKYPKWINFRQRVLDHAQKELADKTDITFEYEAIKKGRSVHKVKFTIKSNPEGMPQMPTEDIQEKLDKVIDNDEDINVISQKGKEMGLTISNKVIQEWLKYGKDNVLETMSAIQYKSNIKNPIGYISTVLAKKKEETIEVAAEDPVQKALREVKAAYISSSRKARIEVIPKFIVADTAKEIFLKYMNEFEAVALWKEKGDEIVDEINDHNKSMVY